MKATTSTLLFCCCCCCFGFLYVHFNFILLVFNDLHRRHYRHYRNSRDKLRNHGKITFYIVDHLPVYFFTARTKIYFRSFSQLETSERTAEVYETPIDVHFLNFHDSTFRTSFTVVSVTDLTEFTLIKVKESSWLKFDMPVVCIVHQPPPRHSLIRLTRMESFQNCTEAHYNCNRNYQISKQIR